MLLTSRLCLSALFMASLAACLPVDGAPKPRDIAPRSRKYSIVNVDGGSTDQPTTIVDEKTVTLEVTTTPASSSSKPTSTTVNKQPPPSPSPETTSTKAVVVTIVITETASPTKFYDDGKWHTLYPVKTFLGDVVATPTASSDSASLTAAPSDP